MRAAYAITRLNLLRLVRDRTNLFFVFALPLILVAALGLTFGGAGSTRIGVVVSAGAGALGTVLVDDLSSADLDVEVHTRGSLEQLEEDVGDGSLTLGLVVPAGYDEALRTGGSAELTVVATRDAALTAVAQGIEAAAARQSAQVRAARLAIDHAGIGFDAALEQATRAQAALAGISIETSTLGEATFPGLDDRFALGAQSQTVMFMFLTSLTAATQLVLTRQLGVSRRMLATPTPVRWILLGELSGRFAVAMLQGLVVVTASAVLFGVSWGPLASALSVVVLFALVGTGAAMVVGVFARNPDQAATVGVVVSLVLGAIGGAMVPSELFEPPMSTIARLTPHFWAIDALRDVALGDAGLADILIQLVVLAAYAGLLVVIGTWGLRRSLTRG